MHWVKQAKYLEDYKLLLTFNSKEKKVVDFKKMLKGFNGVFRPLKDLDFFKQFTLDHYTIVWPNEIDLCPDVLYMKGESVNEESKKYIKQSNNKTIKKPSKKLTKK